MKPRLLLSALVGLLVAGFACGAVAQPTDYPVTQGKTYKFLRIADGVYYAIGGLGGHETVIVNDKDVVLVDTGTTPEGARKLLADIRQITDKPVRTVVDTHWHYDHADGNQVFGPGVEIIAHDTAYTALTTRDVLHSEPFKTSQPFYDSAAVEAVRRQVAQAQDPAAKRAATEKLAEAEDLHRQLIEVRPMPPTLTFSTSLTLHRGAREIDLLFLGRGHTAGDIMVFLPKEKIICTGDFMGRSTGNMGDSYPDEWVAALEKLKGLDWSVDLPGHGLPFNDKARIAAFQSYLTDAARQVARLHDQGLSAQDAAARVDMTAHVKDYPNIEKGMAVREVTGLYGWLEKASPAARKFLSP
jgi:cyclase